MVEIAENFFVFDLKIDFWVVSRILFFDDSGFEGLVPRRFVLQGGKLPVGLWVGYCPCC